MSQENHIEYLNSLSSNNESVGEYEQLSIFTNNDCNK